MALEIKMSVTPPLADLTLRGELDVSAVARIGWTVDQALSRGCTVIAMDLRNVTSVDCAGIDALADTRHRLDAVSSHLHVTGRSPQVSRMISLTHTDGLFDAFQLAPQAR
jgi:anti-anti-sigma factor